MPRRILIAPDKFKGSLSAASAAAAIAEGVRRLDPNAMLDICPIADGGEGFMEALAVAQDGWWVDCPAVDALSRPIDSRYLVVDEPEGPVAIIEMAETAGMWRLSPQERNPMLATTRGVGQQMAHAIDTQAVKRIILGLGGSATNDGGSGMAAALGVLFYDASDRQIEPGPSVLASLRRVDLSKRLPLPEITAACDVDNPLLGERGATAVFSAQKGASSEMMPVLEMALSQLAEISGGMEQALVPGAGAAGGLGFGLMHFAQARLVSGFDLLARLLDLESRVVAADHIVTGEGSIDHQSLAGKGPVALARLGRSNGVPVTGFCGVADQAARESGLFKGLHALADSGLPAETLIAEAAGLLTERVRVSNFLEL